MSNVYQIQMFGILGPVSKAGVKSGSKIVVPTPVPLVSTGGTPIKEVSNLGNILILPRHIGHVSSVSPFDSVTNVDNALAAVLSHPVGGRLQGFW